MEQYSEDLNDQQDAQATNETQANEETPRAPRRRAESSGRPTRRSASRQTSRRESDDGGYTPTGTRRYRTSRARGYAAEVEVPGFLTAMAPFVEMGLLALAALLALISLISAIVAFTTPSPEEVAAQQLAAEQAMTPSERVAAAEATVDENGIIHGTTASGINFTIRDADATATGVKAIETNSADTASSSSAAADENAESSSAAADDTASSSSAAADESAESSSSSSSSADEGSESAAASSAAANEQKAEITEAAAGTKVSFAAVGDQIASDFALELADGYSGEVGDGNYDFKPFYKEVKPYLQKFNLRYINQETTLIGGTDDYPVSGYPMFVSPESCAEAIADTGFNLVNFTTNHSYDAGTDGIEYSQKVWAKYPQILVGGSYASQQDRETVQMIESNGIRFAFLAYSYGDNSYDNPKKEPNSYYAVAFDETTAGEDITRAKQVADVVIVSMHWGDEYSDTPNDSQKKQAQWLADQGVDLVVGTHAHNIQPVEYYTGKDGNKTPVVFGLGDFVSGWTLTDTILSGIFTCDFVKDEEGVISITDEAWHPTIEWSDGKGQTYVRMLENMDVATINANTRTEDWPGSSFPHIYSLTSQVITKIPVSWGSDAAAKEKAAAEGANATATNAGTADGYDEALYDDEEYADDEVYADEEEYTDDEEYVDDEEYTDDESSDDEEYTDDEESSDEEYVDDEEYTDDESSDEEEEE